MEVEGGEQERMIWVVRKDCFQEEEMNDEHCPVKAICDVFPHYLV